MPAPQFTPGEVLEIRHQNARGQLDVKTWADTKRCSLETIRRIARGETYRHQAGVKAHPTYGGLHGQPTGQRPAVGVQSPAQSPAPFVPPAQLPGIAEATELEDPDVAASFARLQASLAMPVPGDPAASLAVSLLDELQAAGEAQRPAKVLPEGGSELG